MGQPYVDYPGTSGRTAHAPSVNLLDADTAHVYQSVGLWTQRSEADTVTHETEATATVGGKVVQFLAASPAGDCSLRAGVPPSGGLPVVAGSTEYSLVIRGRTLGGVDRTAYNGGDWYEGTTWKGFYSGADITLPASGAWVDLVATVTSHADADGVNMYMKIRDAVDDEVFQLDVACIRLGDDPTFVPSHNIVGDLDMVTDFHYPLSEWDTGGELRVVSCRVGNDGWELITRTTAGKWYVRYGDGSVNRGAEPTYTTGEDRVLLRNFFDLSAGEWTFYIDGDEDGTAGSLSTNPGTRGSGNVGVAGYPTVGPGEFDGFVYKVTVYDGDSEAGAPAVLTYDPRQALAAVS